MRTYPRNKKIETTNKDDEMSPSPSEIVMVAPRPNVSDSTEAGPSRLHRFSVSASSTYPDGIDDVESLTERLTSDFIWLTDVEGGAKGTPFQQRENAFYGRCKILKVEFSFSVINLRELATNIYNIQSTYRSVSWGTLI